MARLTLARRRKPHSMPELNTASLPDMIFTVLFFFMIVTSIRQSDQKLDYTEPEAPHVEKQASAKSTIYIYAGYLHGDSSQVRVQVGSDIIDSTAQIAQKVEAKRKAMNAANAKKLRVEICADRHADMRTINAIKHQLQLAGALNVVYSAKKAQ